MVKIRAFISKKAVPRGIDIDNKEYWQPYAITIKKKNGGGGDDGGDDDEPTVEKCIITIATIPESATIVATDEDGNVYRSKTFQVTKGKSVTIVATPDASSTGYKPTTKVLTSQDTNQDTLNYTFILDEADPVDETTTINIVSNVAGVLTYVYSSQGLLINPEGENTVQGVLIGSVIKIKPVKEGYKLRTSSEGTIVEENGEDFIIGITVTRNLLINLSLEAITDEAPVIKGVENDYSAFYEAQEFVRSFKSTFYKIRVYGDTQISLVTSWAESSADPNGGQSIIDTEETHHGEQDISFKLNLTENNTGLRRTYNFTIIAENKSGEQVSKSFQLIQHAEDIQTHSVGIITKINGVVSSSSDIVRKIDGELVTPNQRIDVPHGDTVTFYTSYLGKEYIEDVVINDDYVWEFNFDVVNISLGTVKDEDGESFNTWKLTLNVPVLGITINDWKTQLIPVIRGTEYIVTGRDTSGQRPDYNSGIQIADGYQLNVLFGPVPTSVVIVRPVDENDNDIVGATVTLKVGVVNHTNGSAFPNGTRVGYTIEASGYEIATLSDGSPLAIIAGVTQNPVVVRLIRMVEYVDVVIRTTLNQQLATEAQVFIDSQYIGTGSPFTVENLVNGQSYNYRIDLDGEVSKSGAFTASPNLVVDVEYTNTPDKYNLQVSMLSPSDAKIEVNDYTDGQTYMAYGNLFAQIPAGHRITILYSKEGYLGKYIPVGAGDYPPGDVNGTILMDSDKIYDNLTLEELPPLVSCTYSLVVTPSDCIVEFSETDGGNYQEYPNQTYNTYVGRTVYWRVSKQGYVTQTGNSGVLSGNKTDNVTLVQEQPNVNNNVLFVIRSIKDRDTNEDLTGVTVKLQLKGINQVDNKTVTQSDLNEVSDNPPAAWNDEIGKFGGVAERGTDVKILITKQGYDDYNRWNSNNISIAPDYNNNNIFYLDVIMQTPKCSFVLYPIQNLSQEDISPDIVYIKEGNGMFDESDKVSLVGNRYRKEVNRGADVYYLVLKNGYYGTYGHEDDVEYSQSKSVTLIAAPPASDTVEIILTGDFRHRGAIVDPMLNQGGMTIYDAPVPIAYSLTSYRICGSTYIGQDNLYVYKFVVPKNELIIFTTTYNNRVIQCIGSFSKNSSILMHFETEPTFVLNDVLTHSPNLYAYNMVDGEISYSTDSSFGLILTDINGVNVPDYRGITQDHAKAYYINESVEGLHVKGTFTSNPSPVNDNIEINIPFGDMLTLYLNFVFPYIKLTIDGEIINAENQNKNIYFDYRGETKQINIESNDSWVIE